MVSNSYSANDQSRLTVLRRFEMLDNSPEPALDSITAFVAWFYKAPISAIALILNDRIIIKSLYGFENSQADHCPKWCTSAIATDDIFCITNALENPLTKADPLVVGEFGLRFYAAAPLRTREGYSLGILYVIDRKPRDISVSEKEFLQRMASLVVDLIESNLTTNRLATIIASLANQLSHFESLTADDQLLQMLAENLAQVLDVAYVFIGAPGVHGNELPATVAFYAGGAVISEEQDYYRTTNWPYIPLLHADQNEIYYPSNVQYLFPDERRLSDLRIESYVGVKLIDSALSGFGAIAILDTKPIKNIGIIRSVLAALKRIALAVLKGRRATTVKRNKSETRDNSSHVGFNHSIIGKSKQQQLAWLADRVTGDSTAIRKTRELLRLPIIKQADTVLLMGETGTGKGVCALAIHEGAGTRGSFIEVNCAALPRELIESELFGHEKGSFTGAMARKIGLFEEANGGTIFLDEIAELPPDLQVKLLSVLQRRELRRVGGAQTIPIDVRVIAATNRPIKLALNDGSFRHDLFFRIGSCRIELPPLRNRGDDIILLARHFMVEMVKSNEYCVERLVTEAEELLKQYDWPGNVRQLSNVIRYAIILESGNVISYETIHHALEEEKKLFNPDRLTALPAPVQSYKERKRILITDAEVHTITTMLVGNRNNKTKTANELGLTRGQLDYRLKLIDQMTRR